MHIQNLSLIVGTSACNACCPFCISKMTPTQGVTVKQETTINWRNFEKSCQFAVCNNVTTVLLTGKGEPLLYPDHVTQYLSHIEQYRFPFIELQTNGICLEQKMSFYEKKLADWYDMWLTTIAISIVHYNPEKNREIYMPYAEKYIDLPSLIAVLHTHWFLVRLACTMVYGYIDSEAEVKNLIAFAKENHVEQLTIRPINKPETTENKTMDTWIREHSLSKTVQKNIWQYLVTAWNVLMQLPYGGIVYDVEWQNVCYTNSLTIDASGQTVRQLIFFPDGSLRYDWKYEGAVLL